MNSWKTEGHVNEEGHLVMSYSYFNSAGNTNAPHIYIFQTDGILLIERSWCKDLSVEVRWKRQKWKIQGGRICTKDLDEDEFEGEGEYEGHFTYRELDEETAKHIAKWQFEQQVLT